MTTHPPVDAIITWVDGYDKAHQEKLAHYFTHLGISRPKSADPTRYNQCGEINYCVRSLLHFAPWIRTIYIVTDAQTPSILSTLKGTPFEDKVKLIDHRVIFEGYESYLPTFNSLTIELMMWRIPDLAEKFIYFNDDCFLLRPVTYSDFFCDDKLVLRGYWRKQAAQKCYYRFQSLISRLMHRAKPRIKIDEHRAWQENAARWVGFHKRFFHLPHLPFPLNKSIFENFFRDHPDILIQNLSFALRNRQQIWPVSLVVHLAIFHKQVVFDNSLKAIAVNPAFHSLNKIKARLAAAAGNNQVAFICMQSLDTATNATQKMMLQWMEVILKHDHCNFSDR